MSLQRLNTARERIDAVCAEYNYFNPTYCAPGLNSTASVHAGDTHGRFLYPPDPKQLKADLQTMFERFLVLESEAVDNAYRRISLHAWEMASDEYNSFDWEKLTEIIGHEMKDLKEQSYHVEVSDLVTLRSVPTCL